ncbi:MAG: DUF4102 domain-containing protein [Rhodocyclaceae bacterium]|nr:DUF4102 domain-containing protein [Rhodocyclaceae bacterium]MBX3667128.1 DUF4102 domain-containing protein [Rhodocyclaceae bacterium]
MGKLADVQIRHWIRAGKPVARAQGDFPGLTFTLSAKGTASWVLRYRDGGKPNELTLGRYPDFTIATAKTAALEARARIQLGTDVATEKRRASMERAAAKDFRQLATDYMDMAFPACRRTRSSSDGTTSRTSSCPSWTDWRPDRSQRPSWWR